MEKTLLIKELAKKLELTPKAIRFYEEQGLIPNVKRTDNNYRFYDNDDYKKLSFIKKARALGMSVNEIREIFEIRENGSMPCCHVVAMLEKHKLDVQKKIKDLSEFENQLTKTINLFQANMDIGKNGKICGLIENLFE